MLSPSFFQRTSQLSSEEIELAHQIIAGSQPFRLYLHAAVADLSRGIDNRFFHFSGRSGMVMGISFEGLRIYTIVGAVGDEVVGEMSRDRGHVEFHIPESYKERIKSLTGERLEREEKLRYYRLEKRDRFAEEPAEIQRLEPRHAPEVAKFYGSHYGGTIFSAWMLEQPFWGLYLNGELAATGGTVVIHRESGAANIGNFLTAPKFRGRGLAKVVARRLINDLMDQGISDFTLGTTEENQAAWRSYEAIGFQKIGDRWELEIRAEA